METCITSYPEPGPLPIERLDAVGYATALAAARAILDAAPLPPLDAVIHGIGVRLHTNNLHWRRFWSANWFAPDQWATLSGGSSPGEPRVHLYAATPAGATAPWAGYSAENNTAFLSGDAPYGPLRALAFVAVARLLAEEEAAHLLPGLCVRKNDRGVLLLSGPGADLSAHLPGLMEHADAHLIAFDGILIRYGLVRMVDGVSLLPTLIIDEKGVTVPGYRLFPWLDTYGYAEPRADARCLTLEGKEVYCFARDLDLGRIPEAFAFPLEQTWYVPTQIVAARPELIGVLWPGPEPLTTRRDSADESQECSGLENVPPLSPDLWERFGAWARQATSSPAMTDAPSTRSLLDEIGPETVAQALVRLRANSRARAMVSPQRLWPGHAGGQPLRPLQITRVELIDHGKSTPLAPDALSEQPASDAANLFLPGEEQVARVLTGMLQRAIGGEGS